MEKIKREWALESDVIEILADKVDEIIEYINHQDIVIKDKIFNAAAGMADLIAKIPRSTKKDPSGSMTKDTER